MIATTFNGNFPGEICIHLP